MKPVFFLFACVATSAHATEMDFVTDPSVCGLELIDRHEKAMTFDGANFWEIEYHCEVQPAITPPDWKTDITEVRPGYCEEPGAVFPEMFVFRSGPQEPGLLYVYGHNGDPVIYHLCPQ